MSLLTQLNADDWPRFVHPFWLGIESVDLAGAQLLLGRFDPLAFSAELVAESQIVLPTDIARSVASRQAEYFAARLLARRLLDKRGISADVGRHQDRSPIWPAALAGSLSHSDDWAGCLLADAGYRYAGLDIECVVMPVLMAEIMDLVLTTDDRQLLSQAGEQQHLFTLIFSAKECFYKLAYPAYQQFFDFSALSVLQVDWSRSCLHVQANQDLLPFCCAGQQFDIHFLLSNDRVITWAIVP